MKNWPAKRLIASALTAGLVALDVYSWISGAGNFESRILLGVGIVLGTLYVVRGASLPESMHSVSTSHWFGGTGINADDDPSNLSPKVYLPILFTAILIASVLFFRYRH